MDSFAPYLLAFFICCSLVLASFYYRYSVLNKKFGSKHQPAGHPYCWYALVLQSAPCVAATFEIQLDTIISILSLFATGVWLFFALRDLRKSKTALANTPAVIAHEGGHEGIVAYGLVLKGLDQMYVDLFGIDTKVLVESKIEIESLKELIAKKLGDAGVNVVATKASAKCWLTAQMKTQPGPKQTGSVTTIYVQVGETLTNDRLDVINVRANAPLFSTVTVAMCDGIPSAESISAALGERLDQFILERNS